MIGSPEVNKEIRRVVSPLLRECGFQTVSTRNNWRQDSEAICVLNIRSVGSYFSDVTGWPSQSLVCHVGLYFRCIPSDFEVAIDKKTGEIAPPEYSCHLRLVLHSGIDQTGLTIGLANPDERKRSDIWWIDPRGANIVEAIKDLSGSILQQAIPFFATFSSPQAALEKIRQEKDCYDKYYRAYYIAKHINTADHQHFFRLAKDEAHRIGVSFPHIGK